MSKIVLSPLSERQTELKFQSNQAAWCHRNTSLKLLTACSIGGENKKQARRKRDSDNLKKQLITYFYRTHNSPSTSTSFTLMATSGSTLLPERVVEKKKKNLHDLNSIIRVRCILFYSQHIALLVPAMLAQPPKTSSRLPRRIVLLRCSKSLSDDLKDKFFRVRLPLGTRHIQLLTAPKQQQ